MPTDAAVSAFLAGQVWRGGGEAGMLGCWLRALQAFLVYFQRRSRCRRRLQQAVLVLACAPTSDDQLLECCLVMIEAIEQSQTIWGAVRVM